MVLNLCVDMPCFELIDFFRHFANDLKDIEFEDAELIETSSNQQFITFKSSMQDFSEETRIPHHQPRKNEIVNKIKINNGDLKNWHYDPDYSKSATKFAIQTRDVSAVLKLICQTLEIDILAEIQTVSLQDNSVLLILNKIAFFDFDILLRSFNETKLKSYYFNDAHKTFYPLFITSKSVPSTNSEYIRDFPNTSTEIALSSLKHLFSAYKVDSKYLKNHSNSLKIDKNYALTKSFEVNESNQIASIIECKRKDLTQVFKSLTKLLESNTKVLVYEYKDFIHILIMNAKINLLNSQVYKLIKHKYLIQNDVKVFPIDIRDNNTQSYSDNSIRILLHAGENDYFKGFHILEISEDNARTINYFSRYNPNFKCTMHDSISSNVFRSNKINYSNVISFDEYVPSDSSEIDTTLKDIILNDDPKAAHTEFTNSHSIVNTSFTNFVHEDETIRNEVKSLSIQEIQSKEHDIYNKLRSMDFDDRNSADFIHLWEEITDLALIKTTDIRNQFEVFVNLITQLFWYELTHLINPNMLGKFDSFYSNNKSQLAANTILQNKILNVLRDKSPLNFDQIIDLYNIKKEHIDYKLRTLYLVILAKSTHDKVFISRELEEIVCILNINKNINIGKFSLFKLVSALSPANSNHNDETKPAEYLSRLADLHKQLNAIEKLDLSSNTSLSIISLASKFPDTADFIHSQITNEYNNEYLIRLKSFLRSIHDEVHSDQQLSATLNFISNKINDDKKSCKLLSVVLNLLDSKLSSKIPDILKNIGVNSVSLLAMHSDIWKQVIGDETFINVIKNSIESLINSETLYLTDSQIINVITLLDTLVEAQNSSNSMNIISYVNEKMLAIWSKNKISNSQYIYILNSKHLDLANLYVNRLINRKISRTHFAAWKDSSDTGDYQLQIQYAKYLCNISKIDKAFNILSKVLDHLTILIRNRTINSVNYPLHKLIADLTNVLPLTGKFTKVNDILTRIDELTQQNNYFGRSVFSVERIEIYVAFINCYASFSMNKEAESQLISLLEKILPAHHSASNEHLLFVFQKLWKSIVNNLPHLTSKIISVFERIFTNSATTTEYITNFSIYKQFSEFMNSSTNKIPSIITFNNNADSFSIDSEFVLFKTWLEVAGEIKILDRVDIIDFIETAYQQILLTNSGLKGFDELCEFLNANIEPNREISKEEEKIINQEISEIKERIAQIYSELIK